MCWIGKVKKDLMRFGGNLKVAETEECGGNMLMRQRTYYIFNGNAAKVSAKVLISNREGTVNKPLYNNINFNRWHKISCSKVHRFQNDYKFIFLQMNPKLIHLNI